MTVIIFLNMHLYAKLAETSCNLLRMQGFTLRIFIITYSCTLHNLLDSFSFAPQYMKPRPEEGADSVPIDRTGLTARTAGIGLIGPSVFEFECAMLGLGRGVCA